MLARVTGATVIGIDAISVTVEAHLADGLPAFHLVGLADTAVQESRERVRAALVSSGLGFPVRRITVNLAPADLRKVGPLLDLPIALALLAASGRIPAESLAGSVFAGELGLDGRIRSCPGMLCVSELAARSGLAGCLYVSDSDAAEAALVRGVRIVPVSTLAGLVDHLSGRNPLSEYQEPAPGDTARAGSESLAKRRAQAGALFGRICGQARAKRALEISAAGHHHLLLVGPPGAGKTSLASILPHLMPPLRGSEAVDVAKIRSVARSSLPGIDLGMQRPFRSPHHSTSAAGLAGGGSGVPKPGEMSLAHGGVLFLDEMLEFPASALDALRQPMSDGEIEIVRGTLRCRFPARFLLVGSTNPCRCGFLGDPEKMCSCTPGQIAAYRSRLSGPLVDRIDLQVRVERPRAAELLSDASDGDLEASAGRIERAWVSRGAGGPRPIAPSAIHFLSEAIDGLSMSARGAMSVLEVARTIADLDEVTGNVGVDQVAEALTYRSSGTSGQGWGPSALGAA